MPGRPVSTAREWKAALSVTALAYLLTALTHSAVTSPLMPPTQVLSVTEI